MRTKLTVFNQIDRNGKVKVANSKEEIENLLTNSNNFGHLLTNGLIDESLNSEERFQKQATVDITKIVGKIENIEVIENGSGFGGLPIYEVYGDITFLPKDGSKFVEECFDQNLVTIGIRALGQNRMVDNQIVTDITKVICWDTITR